MFRRIITSSLIFVRTFHGLRYSNRTHCAVFNIIKYIGVPIRQSIYFSLAFVSATQPSNLNKMSGDTILEHVLRNADQLFDENHFQEAFDVLSGFSDQSLPDIKWRQARALYSFSKETDDKDERQKRLRQAHELILAALDKDDNNFAVHKWAAVIIDANAELDGIKSRVQKLELVKKHMLRAIELNNNDATCWYILGKFEYGLAELPWIQRKLVSAIFATPPTGSFERALECHQRAEEIKPGFYTMNWLMLGKCYMAQKNMEEAKKYLEKAANCNVLNADDKNCKEEATQLLRKF